MKLEGKFVLKVAGTLTVISLITAALLGIVNELTADKIAQFNREKTEAALATVVADGARFEPIEITQALSHAATDHSGKLTEAYRVIVDNEDAGYAFKIVASGSQGDIEMIVGVDTEKAVTGVSVVNSSETSGIGSRVVSNENGMLDQIKDRTGAGSLVVGKNIDAISGATVSSKGVTKGVNAALGVAEALD